jgi:hypothetical protein
MYNILVGIPEGKRTLGKPRRRLEEKFKMYLREICLGMCKLDASGSE